MATKPKKKLEGKDLVKYGLNHSKYQNINLNERIKDDFDFQYNDSHQVEVVKVGETDLIKEVNSHRDEVGLVNVMRLAIAQGRDPFTAFAKTEAGVPVAIDPNATLDQVQALMDSTLGKKAEIAKTLGVSVQELEAAIKAGTVADLISKVNAEVTAPVEEEGGKE